MVSTLVPTNEITHAIDIFNSIEKRQMENLVPHKVIALHNLLTIPVSVASEERPFSKLKLAKTFLRIGIGQDRLNNLAIIHIDRERSGHLCGRVCHLKSKKNKQFHSSFLC